MRLLIVDDEPAARTRLAALVEEIDPAIEIVGEAPDGVAALELARTRLPEVILLDIAMPEVDGLDVARHLPDPRPLIIFQTAYSEYALEAFDATGARLRRQAGAQGAPGAGARTRARAADDARAGGRVECRFARAGASRTRSPAGASGAAARAARARPPAPAAQRRAPVRGRGRSGPRAYARRVTGHRLHAGELETRLAAGFVRVSRADLVNLAHIVSHRQQRRRVGHPDARRRIDRARQPATGGGGEGGVGW